MMNKYIYEKKKLTIETPKYSRNILARQNSKQWTNLNLRYLSIQIHYSNCNNARSDLKSRDTTVEHINNQYRFRYNDHTLYLEGLYKSIVDYIDGVGTLNSSISCKPPSVQL